MCIGNKWLLKPILLSTILLSAMLVGPQAATPQVSGSACSITCPLIDGCIVTSAFNPARNLNGTTRAHKGIDLEAGRNTPVFPVKDGKVEFSGYQVNKNGVGWGNFISILHDDGRRSIYGHLISQPTIPSGTRVISGQTEIGRVNSTGGSTGDHLHLEYLEPAKTVNDSLRIDPAACLTPNTTSPADLFLGEYHVNYNERVLSGKDVCSPEDFSIDVSIYKTQNGSIALQVSQFIVPLVESTNGAYVGTGTASYPDDEGTTRASIELVVNSNKILSGKAVWRWKDPDIGQCSGDGTFSGNMILSAPTT